LRSQVPHPVAGLMGFLDSLAVIGFNLVLVGCTIPPYIVAKVAVLTSKLKPIGLKSARTQAVLFTTCIFWRVLFGLCCWVRVRAPDLSSFRRLMGSTGRPVVVVANHMSFLDTILLVSMMPLSHIVKIKMFVSGALLKMPCVGTIIRAAGHIAVPFKAGSDINSFELDRELMAKRQQDLEDHVRQGGVGGWFPEGRLNPGDVSVVGQFRAGGFILPVHVDVEVWCAAFVGNSVCWPRASGVGGHAASIGARHFRLCESSWDFVSKANGGPGLEDEQAACRFLANAAHARVQKAVDELISEGFVGQREAKGGKEPLLEAN